MGCGASKEATNAVVVEKPKVYNKGGTFFMMLCVRYSDCS